MKINQKAPLVSRTEIFISAPPATVWTLLTDINGWSSWQKGVTHARMEGSLDIGAVFKWKAGGIKITSTLQEIEAERQIGWTGKAFGTQAVDIWRLKPHEKGTLVVTEESLGGWLAGLVKIIMPRFLEKQKSAALADLKLAAETRSRKDANGTELR